VHTTVAEELNNAIKMRRLNDVGHLEQDLVFGDADGVVVVPAEVEAQVLALVALPICQAWWLQLQLCLSSEFQYHLVI
jgi:hypothetical protein